MGPAEENNPSLRTQHIRALSPTFTMWFIWNTQMLSKGRRRRIGSLLPDSWVKKCALGNEQCCFSLPTGLRILRRSHVCGCSLFSSSASSSSSSVWSRRRCRRRRPRRHRRYPYMRWTCSCETYVLGSLYFLCKARARHLCSVSVSGCFRCLMSRTSQNLQQRPHVAATVTEQADIGE